MTRRDRLAVGAVVLAYVVVAGVLAAILPLWVDELYTLHSTRNGPIAAVHSAISFEVQGPAYFVLESLWRLVFHGPLAARVPSILFGAATIVVAVALARRLIPEVRPPLVALAVACHPLAVWAAPETRLYAMAMALGATLTYLIVRTHLEGWRRGRVILIACATLALYTQYYQGFLLAAAGLALIVLWRPREVAWYALEMAIVLVLALPFLYTMRGVAGAEAGARGAGFPSFGVLRSETMASLGGLSIGVSHALQSTAVTKIGNLVQRLLHLGLVVLTAWALWRQRRNRATLIGTGLPAMIATFGLLIGLVLTTLAGSWWSFKYQIAFLVPAQLMLLGALRGRFATVAIVALALSSAVSTVVEQAPLAKRGDCRRVARTLEQLETDGEPIVVQPGDDVLCVAYYYYGRNRLVPAAAATTPQRWHLDELIARDLSDVPQSWRLDDLIPPSPAALIAILERAGAGGRVWWFRDQFGPDLEAVPGWKIDRSLHFEGKTTLRHLVRD